MGAISVKIRRLAHHGAQRADVAPAADDDDDETETPEVVGGQVEDNLFA